MADTRIALELEKGQVRVSVIDTGIGMTREEQVRLFTKIFRADNAAVQEAGGTGLGLVITRTLVQMHGGDLEVSIAPGEGSTFSFTLPLVQEPIAAAPPLASAITPAGKRLLLAEKSSPYYR